MTRIRYPQTEDFPGYIAERIDWNGTVRWANEIIRLMNSAYTAEVNNPAYCTIDEAGRPLRAESVHRQYNSVEVRERFLTRSRDIHERGGRITIIRRPNYPEALLGYSKIGPAPKMTERDGGIYGSYDYEGHYVNNVVTNPDFFGQGIGSIALHAGLLASHVESGDPLVLDAMQGNERANSWYRRLGFMPQPEVPTSTMTFDTQEIPQQYYYAPNAGVVMAHLAGLHYMDRSKDYHDAIARAEVY